MTVNGTTHTTEDTTMYVWYLDVFGQCQLLKESPAVLSLRNLCEEHGSSCEGHPGQPSFLIKTWKNIECKTDNHIPLVVPGVQSNRTQRPKLWATGSPHKLWATTSDM